MRRMAGLAAMIGLLSATLALALGCAPQAPAEQSAREFFQGKTIRAVISSGAGGSADTYVRQIAPYLSKELGAQIKVENMGGTEGTNWAYNEGSKDGLTWVAKAFDAIWLNDLLKASGTLYKAEKYIYLADLGPSATLMMTSPKLPYKTLDDMRKAKGLKGGATTAKGSLTTKSAVVFDVLGLDGKVVTGFDSVKALTLALARGEVDFVVTNDTTAAADEEAGYLINFLAIGEKSRAVPKAPTLSELGIKVSKDLEIAYKAVSTPSGYAVAMPPDVPANRVDFLRKAFQKVNDDKAFQDEITKAYGIWNPMRLGKEVQDDLAAVMGEAGLADQIEAILAKYVAAR